MKNTIFNIQTLAESNLVKKHFNVTMLEDYSPAEWVPQMIEQNLCAHRDHNFFRNLADLYGIPYVRNIHTPLSAKRVIAYRVPTATLINAQLYPYQEDGKLFIATSTPFIEKEVLDDVLSFTGRAGYQLIMTTPHQIREALKNIHYLEFSVIAEGNLKYSKKNLSASPPIVLRVTQLMVTIGLIIIASVFIFPRDFLLWVFFIVNILYIYLNGLRLATFVRSITSPDKVLLNISREDIELLDDSSLPAYTVLVPLRFESGMVPSLVKRLARLDYPRSKLQILFLVGVDDNETIESIRRQGVDNALTPSDFSEYSHMSIVKVPKAHVDTKPLVCNYGLELATGDYTVIFDAEDKPEPDQLKKAVAGFQVSSLDTICLQGKLTFYNSRKNMLTKFFTLEYGMWYDFFLPGLQSIGSPVPLGGTSNHFVTNALRQTGQWDPYNVTEDADLGMRIYRSNRKVRILNSYTYEEATSTMGAWLKQRARWEKGFLATLIVHLRHAGTLYKELGFKKFIYGVTIFFGNFYMPFINPLLWIITILWLFNVFTLGTLPAYVWVPAVINLVVGNAIHITIHFLAALRLKRYDLIPFVFLVPLYWILISIATYKAVFELYFRPYQWNKTPHGRRSPRKSTP